MKKALTPVIVFICLMFGTSLVAQNFMGMWKSIDDETGKAKSYVKIYKATNGKYYGQVMKLLADKDTVTCFKCTDYRKNKPVLGLNVITGMVLSKEGGLEGGTICDPKNGKIYKCKIKVVDGKLDVRGYIGFSLIGRTQTWLPVKDEK